MLRVQAQLGFAWVRDYSGPSRPWVMIPSQVGHTEECGVLAWCDCHRPEPTASSFPSMLSFYFLPVLLLLLPALGGGGQTLHF